MVAISPMWLLSPKNVASPNFDVFVLTVKIGADVEDNTNKRM